MTVPSVLIASDSFKGSASSRGVGNVAMDVARTVAGAKRAAAGMLRYMGLA